MTRGLVNADGSWRLPLTLHGAPIEQLDVDALYGPSSRSGLQARHIASALRGDFANGLPMPRRGAPSMDTPDGHADSGIIGAWSGRQPGLTSVASLRPGSAAPRRGARLSP